MPEKLNSDGFSAKTRTVDHIGCSLLNRGDQSTEIPRIVFEVRVLDNGDLSRRQRNPRANRRPLAPIDLLKMNLDRGGGDMVRTDESRVLLKPFQKFPRSIIRQIGRAH